MKFELSFGKVDYNDSGSKNCAITVDVRLNVRERDGNRQLTLSICGNVWNPEKTDCYSCGQNIEELAALLPHDARMQRVAAIWREWHLNDMHAGSPAQESFVQTLPRELRYKSHTAISTALKDAGLDPDASFLHNGAPYVYGSAWLLRELPPEVVAEVESWWQSLPSSHYGVVMEELMEQIKVLEARIALNKERLKQLKFPGDAWNFDALMAHLEAMQVNGCMIGTTITRG